MNLSDNSSLTDEELLFKARALQQTNEVKAANITSALISRYMKIIIMKANKMKNRVADRDDLVSEGFIGLMSAIRSYDQSKGGFSAFANTCINNRMKSHLSTAKHSPAKAEGFDFNLIEDVSPHADELLIEKESENEFLLKIKEQLSSLEYDVLTLFMNGYTYQQVSEKLGKSTKSVDNALSRARGKLKEKDIIAN